MREFENWLLCAGALQRGGHKEIGIPSNAAAVAKQWLQSPPQPIDEERGGVVTMQSKRSAHKHLFYPSSVFDCISMRRDNLTIS